MTAPNTLLACSVSGKVRWLAPSHRIEAVYFTQARRLPGGMGRGHQERRLTPPGGSQVLGQGLLAAFPQPSPRGGSLQDQHEQGQRSWHGHFQYLPLPVPAGLGSSPQPQRLNTCVPRGFPADPTGVGGQGFQPRSLSPTAVPKGPPDTVVGAHPSWGSLRVGSPQEQSSFPGPCCHLPAPAVLQVSREAFLAAAELLKCKELQRLEQPWRIGGCWVRMSPRAQAGPGLPCCG